MAVNTAQPIGAPGCGAPPTGNMVTLTAQTVATETGASVERAERVLEAATETALRYAPAAPTAVLNEAVLRCCGYLLDHPSDARRSETTGAVSSSWAATQTSALRHSGAMALLSPYKVRRAGAIG